MTTGRLVPTPGHTIGPFFGSALPYPGGDVLAPHDHPAGVRLHGRVTDGAGAPVPDALVELWQADEHGNVVQTPGSLRRLGRQPSSGAWYAAPGPFTGFGRAMVDNAGEYAFQTVRPGPTDEGRPAFFALTLFSRGLMNRLFTRAYLPGQTALLAGDRLLASLPADRRTTLLAVDEGGRSLRFDVRLQGEDETVFLRYPGYDEPPTSRS